MVVNKYLSEWGIENLYKNYHLFSTNFFTFLNNTVPLHEADAECAWRSFYYLLPLFLFLKMAVSSSACKTSVNMHKISIIVPVYNEQKGIENFIIKLKKATVGIIP